MKMSLKTALKKTFMGLFLCVVIALIIVWLSVPFFSEKLIFQPTQLPPQYQYHFDQNFEEINLPPEPNVLINALYFKAQNSKGIIIYFHGNRDNLQRWGGIASTLTQYNYDVFVMDYRGYGKSTGERTEEKLYQDALFCYNFVQKTYNPKEIIFYGRSLGSGFATKLASTNNPRMLILDAPYYSMSKTTGRYMPFMPMSWLLKFPIPTYKWIKHVKCPIHIIHGTNDKLIPLNSSIKLSKINAKLSRLHPVIGGGHNNMHNFESYHEILSQIFTIDKIEFDRQKSSIEFIRKKNND